MPSFSLPALPDGSRLCVLEVGAAPVVRRFLERLDLSGLLQRHLPPLKGPAPELPTPTVRSVLLTILLLARQPLYNLSAWVAAFGPEHLGLLPGQAALLTDDRCGRALDHLHKADRASLLTAVALRVIRTFCLGLSRLHQDTTSVTLAGQYPGQANDPGDGPTARIRRGYNKDHRPDLKQLVYNRTVTADGAVPIHCKIHDGNTSDDKVHLPTWRDLCILVGSADFLYVADSKLCSKENMAPIAKGNGRFLTVMPRTRAEDKRFRSWAQQNAVGWAEVLRKKNPRGKDKPDMVYHGFEDEAGSQEGYRILWYLSSQKKERDKQARQKKVRKACKRLVRLRPPGRGEAFATEQAAREAAGKVLCKAKVGDFVRVRVEEEVEVKHEQVGPGRPGPKTLYRQVPVKRYKVRAEEDEEGLRRAEACDGLFPLMTNDKGLSVAEALSAYKYQPYAEKRHQQLKSVFGVRPMWLKKARRVESLLWLYHLVEVVQALLEREVRRHMSREGIKRLALYPEGRPSKAPTAELVLRALEGHRRYQVFDGQGQVVHTSHDPLPEAARQALVLLGVSPAAYGLPQPPAGHSPS
jgi:transposase